MIRTWPTKSNNYERMKWLLFLLPTILFAQEIPYPQLQCEVDSIHMQFYSGPGEISMNTHIANCISIYVETDLFTYQAFGSNITAVNNWIQDLMDQVSIIYSNEGISIFLASTFVATNAGEDWSSAFSDVTDMLGRFGALRGDTINGRFKHFITRRPLGGGVAWVGTLCTNQTFFLGGQTAFGPYAVSAQLSGTIVPYPTYSWNLEVFAHEMGHTLGSPHTHDCLWGQGDTLAVDDCSPNLCPEITPIEYSTIMSYCHLRAHGIDFTLGFGTEPGNLIRAAVMNATCLPVCNPCPLKLELTGVLSGIYVADTIVVNNATTIGMVTLNAKIVKIENTTIDPVFEIINDGCQ